MNLILTKSFMTLLSAPWDLFIINLTMKNLILKNLMMKNLTIKNLASSLTIMNHTRKVKRRNSPKAQMENQKLSMITTTKKLIILNLLRKAKRRNPPKVLLKRQNPSMILFIKNLIMRILNTMLKSFMTLLSTHWHLFTMKKLIMMSLAIRNLIILNLNMMILTIMRKSCTTLLGTLWQMVTIMNPTTKNITTGKSCMTHLVIQCHCRNISLTSNMRSTGSQQHEETLMPVTNLVMLNFTMMNFTRRGGFRHLDLSQGIGAIRALITKMRSTDSHQHAESLTSIKKLAILNLTIGGLQHPADLSQEVGAVRAACWALAPSRLLD